MPLLAVDPRGDGDVLLPLAQAPVTRGSHGGRSVFLTAAASSDDELAAEAPTAGPDTAELAGMAAELAAKRTTADSDPKNDDETRAQALKALDDFAHSCMADAEQAHLEGVPLPAQLRLLHGAAYGTVRADGAFASAAALASALAFVRGLPTFAETDAACLLVPRAHVQYPCVWYAGSWPADLDVDAPGVFVELHGRHSDAQTWFLPETGGVLGAAVRLPADCALLEEPVFA